MNLQQLHRRYERDGNAATFLGVVKAAQRVANDKAALIEERNRIRRHVVLPDAWFPELAGLANEIGAEDPYARYALAEMAQAASVANCGLVLRNLMSLKLATVSRIAGELERARQAYANAIEGVEILRRFFKPYHNILFDYDEQDARSIEEVAHSGWDKTRSYFEQPLDLFDAASGDPADEWMDVLAWNSDVGDGQGLLSQVDATSRLALRLEHRIGKQRESIAPALHKMHAQCRLIEQEDARLAARYLVALADASIEAGQWDLAAGILEGVLERGLARQEEPVGLHAVLQSAYCYLRSGDLDSCERRLQDIDRDKLNRMAELIITMAAELARYTALDWACRRQAGRLGPSDARDQVTNLMTRVRLIVSPRGETRVSYLRNLFFAKLARDVEHLFAAAQGAPATQFQRFWDAVTNKEGKTAIYTETDWKAEVEILEDGSDGDWTGMGR